MGGAGSWPYPNTRPITRRRSCEKALAVRDVDRGGARRGSLELRLEPPRSAEYLAGPDGRRHRRLRVHRGRRAGSADRRSQLIPFEDPAGGPNFYNFDPKAHYYVNIDNT